MTKMIPNTVNPETKSRAEIRLFDIIKKGLNNDWICLHSLHMLPDTTNKPWVEIDFVLIGGQGVFCLEVKGGRVRYQDGLWLFIDGLDEVHKSHRGPFQQGNEGSQELLAYLRKTLGNDGLPVFGFGVMTPDCEFSPNPPPPDSNPRVLYDARDEGNFNRYAERLISYWRDKFPLAPTCSNAKVAEIANSLRGDFDIVPTLSFNIKRVEEQIIQLTDQQKHAISGMKDNERVVIRGSAGTGKTLCAIEEAIRLARDEQNVLLVCYNRRLAYFMRKATSNIDNITPIHIHGLMSDLVKQAGLEDQLPKLKPGDNDQLFGNAYPELALEAVSLLGQEEHYNALVMDEGQDLLSDNYVYLLDSLLKNGTKAGTWRIFLDEKQNLFDGLNIDLLHSLESDGSAAKFNLTVNCRNTRPIAIQTGIISDVPIEPMLAADGPDVDFEYFKDESDARRKISRLIGRYLSEGVGTEDIVILSAHRKHNSSLADGLTEIPYSLSEPEPDQDIGKGQIGYYTVQSFKGMESEVVILIDLEDIQTSISLSNNYVGSSRAKTKLAIFMNECDREAYGALGLKYGEKLVLAGQNLAS